MLLLPNYVYMLLVSTVLMAIVRPPQSISDQTPQGLTNTDGNGFLSLLNTSTTPSAPAEGSNSAEIICHEQFGRNLDADECHKAISIIDTSRSTSSFGIRHGSRITEYDNELPIEWVSRMLVYMKHVYLGRCRDAIVEP